MERERGGERGEERGGRERERGGGEEGEGEGGGREYKHTCARRQLYTLCSGVCVHN